jgi:hypothetical protein
LTASPPDRNLILAANLAREGVTPVLYSTWNFSEDLSESAQRSERIRPFAINVAGAFRSMASAANLAHLARPARGFAAVGEGHDASRYGTFLAAYFSLVRRKSFPYRFTYRRILKKDSISQSVCGQTFAGAVAGIGSETQTGGEQRAS